MIDGYDLRGICSFDEEKVRFVIEGAYEKICHYLGEDVLVSGELILEVFTGEIDNYIRPMIMDALEQLTA